MKKTLYGLLTFTAALTLFGCEMRDEKKEVKKVVIEKDKEPKADAEMKVYVEPKTAPEHNGAKR